MSDAHAATESLPVTAMEESAEETFAVWQSGCDAGAAYLCALAAARRPQDLLAANAQLLAANVNIIASAAGAMLARAGVREPMLNDA